GYYVIYLRKDEAPLRDALDRGIARMIASGELRQLYERYGIWTPAQEELAHLDAAKLAQVMRREHTHGWRLPPDSGAAPPSPPRDDDPALGHFHAPGHGDRPDGGPGSAIRSRAAPMGPGRLRRAAPGHAPDAPALRPVLSPARAGHPAPPAGRGDRRPGD